MVNCTVFSILYFSLKPQLKNEVLATISDKNSPSPPIQFCKPITLLDASFAHCSSTLLRETRGKKHKIVQIAGFPIIFVTECTYLVFFQTDSLDLISRFCGILWKPF